MQTHVIGTIYDTKAEIYFAPQLFRTSLDFIRGIQQAAKDSNSMLSQHPADYELYILGSWSESTAEITLEQKRLGSIRDFISKTAE